MKKVLLRPDKIQERIGTVENGLTELFRGILRDRNLKPEDVALIPLARRGLNLLPEELINEFDYVEEYALFPLIERISEFDTIILFDDICMHGDQLKKYEDYLKQLLRSFPISRSRTIIWAAYLVKENVRKEIYHKFEKKEICAQKEFNKETKKREIQDIFEYITCKGKIIDPDHMFIRIRFQEKQEFFAFWKSIESIAGDNCSVVEDGINFLHPHKKELGLFIKGDKMKTLKDLGFEYPEFVEEIKIAKFRMVFDLELSENERDQVFTREFVAVPILNPIIDESRFSSKVCEHWSHRFRFCEDGQIPKGICDKEIRFKEEHKILEENYNYHPRYDCIIYNLVKDFSDYFLEKIRKVAKIDVEEICLHRDRFSNVLKALGYFKLE